MDTASPYLPAEWYLMVNVVGLNRHAIRAWRGRNVEEVGEYRVNDEVRVLEWLAHSDNLADLQAEILRNQQCPVFVTTSETSRIGYLAHILG